MPQLAISLLAFLTWAGSPPINGTYVATAYAQTGITSSGQYTHRHVVAADPDVLPLGSRIRIRGAGSYSGEYVVADTGARIEGHKLDIYMPSMKECRRFGVKRVKVDVVSVGDGTRRAARQADEAVKADVENEIARGSIGAAATAIDWAQRNSRP